MSPFEQLHPSLQYHIVNSLGWSTLRPTQLESIAPIQEGKHCLLLAPTAGGKTEAAIIPVLSRMLSENWTGTSVLYVCPIKALLNNLEQRLGYYAGLVGRRVETWHGDISQSRKQRALRDPPDILLTTPESLEGMLISVRIDNANWFANVRTIIVDELHAFVADDRGWHLRSVMNRLERYSERPIQRLGLSATVSNPQELLEWFAPRGEKTVVGTASVSTDADVTIDHVETLENAALIISRLHRGEKRLVFCDSRSGAERLSSLLRGHEIRTFISHASLSIAERKQAEAAFSEEKDCVIVATSTLELGIDVGDLDRVIQIDSPSTVSSFLQRMGRTGRRASGRRNCLFLTTSKNALLLALGVTQRWSEGWVEAARPPAEPWPIVAQQALVTTLQHGELTCNELVDVLAGSFPELPNEDISTLLRHLISTHYLADSDGVIRIGITTEQEYGRGHYRDLLASFTGSNLLTGRHGADEIGYIDPTVLVGERGNKVILLAGRSWRVTQVEWKKRLAWLEPAPGGGTALWMGTGSRTMSPDLAEGIREVLASAAAPTPVLSKRAQNALDDLREQIPAPSAGMQTQEHLADGSTRTWTFAGTRTNRTLARAIPQGNSPMKFDGLSLSAKSADVEAARLVTRSQPVRLSEHEITVLSESMKFAECLPVSLKGRTLVARLFEAEIP